MRSLLLSIRMVKGQDTGPFLLAVKVINDGSVSQVIFDISPGQLLCRQEVGEQADIGGVPFIRLIP